MREKLLVIASFLLVFSFSAVDSAISPMVEPLQSFFSVPSPQVLWLISTCTLGIAIGVFLGPTLTASFSNARLALISSVFLFFPLILFLLTKSFVFALLFRFFFGLGAGVIASVMWWITYYGVTEKYYPAMVTVLMASRPMAIALGVPLAGILAEKTSWQTPFGFFAGLILISALCLVPSIKKEEKKKSFSLRKLFEDYSGAFRVPYTRLYYLGLTINRCCYFGFYSLAGIWFARHYGLSTGSIGTLLLVVGLGEALVNFLVPLLLKRFGHEKVFGFGLLASFFFLLLFIGGRFPLPLTVLFLTFFVILDRVYGMAMILMVPRMFPSSENKTIFGSLTTLAAWLGLAAISFFEGKTLERLGLPGMEAVLLLCFVVGSILLAFVQFKTVWGTPSPAIDGSV